MSTAASLQPSKNKPALGIVVMGVSGCGKTTIARSLARNLRVRFLDADKFHPASNIEKMSSGTPLTDADREPWLDDVGVRLAKAAGEKNVAVLACSALRRSYRERLKRAADLDLLFILLDGSKDVLQRRVGRRTSHFMPATLLDSQLATLERPESDEHAFAVDITQPVKKMIEEILLTPELRGYRPKQAETTVD